MTPSQWLMILILSVLVAEILSGRHKGIYKRRDLLITGGCLLLSRTLMSPAIALAVVSVLAFLLPGYRGALADAPLAPAVVVMILVGELVFYWVHRWAHQPLAHPLLYGMHHTHHSAPYLNITVMARVNVFWPFFQPYTWVSGAAFYLGMVEAATVFFIGMLAWNAFTHTDFRWDDALIARFSFGNKLVRMIELLFVTPRLHHTHHGYGRDGKAYRNFCTMITLYDRLFKTLHIPQGRPAKYGIMGREKHWLEEIIFPLYRSKPTAAPATDGAVGN